MVARCGGTGCEHAQQCTLGGARVEIRFGPKVRRHYRLVMAMEGSRRKIGEAKDGAILMIIVLRQYIRPREKWKRLGRGNGCRGKRRWDEAIENVVVAHCHEERWQRVAPRGQESYGIDACTIGHAQHHLLKRDPTGQVHDASVIAAARVF